MKILILSPNQINRKNWTHQHFRNSIGEQHEVIYYGEGYPNYIFHKRIPDVIKEHKNLDLILTYGVRYTEPFSGIGEINNILKAHIVVDYFSSWGGSFERNHSLFERDKYDLYFGVVGHIVRNLEKNKICEKAFLLPFSVDTNIYKKINVKKDFDVFAVYTVSNNKYPNREKIHKLISEMNTLTSFTKRIEHEKYIQRINQSKICIASNDIFGSLNIKYYEIMACGSMLLTDKPEDLKEVGFIDGKHLVIYKDLNDLKSKILYYLEHEKEREEIAKNGMDFVRENHNNTVRVQQFTKIIQDHLRKK